MSGRYLGSVWGVSMTMRCLGGVWGEDPGGLGGLGGLVGPDGPA